MMKIKLDLVFSKRKNKIFKYDFFNFFFFSVNKMFEFQHNNRRADYIY